MIALRLSSKELGAQHGAILTRLEAGGTADITRIAIAAGAVALDR